MNQTTSLPQSADCDLTEQQVPLCDRPRIPCSECHVETKKLKLNMIRLLLVDDQTLIAQGLQAMLNLESDLEVVGIAGNGQAAIQQVESSTPMSS